MASPTPTTTANQLGSYRRELLEEGVEPDVVRTLVIEAQRAMLSGNGRLVVKGSTPETARELLASRTRV